MKRVLLKSPIYYYEHYILFHWWRFQANQGEFIIFFNIVHLKMIDHCRINTSTKPIIRVKVYDIMAYHFYEYCSIGCPFIIVKNTCAGKRMGGTHQYQTSKPNCFHKLTKSLWSKIRISYNYKLGLRFGCVLEYGLGYGLGLRLGYE